MKRMIKRRTWTTKATPQRQWWHWSTKKNKKVYSSKVTLFFVHMYAIIHISFQSFVGLFVCLFVCSFIIYCLRFCLFFCSYVYYLLVCVFLCFVVCAPLLYLVPCGCAWLHLVLSDCIWFHLGSLICYLIVALGFTYFHFGELCCTWELSVALGRTLMHLVAVVYSGLH